MLSRIVLVAILLAMGCNSNKSEEDESMEWYDSDKVTWIDVEGFGDATNRLYSVTNIRMGPRRQEIHPSPIIRTDVEIKISDLDLVLRRVKLDPTTNEKSYIFYSETKITNQMYAIFLKDTGRSRDDAEIEKAAAGEFARYRFKQSKKRVFGSSTGWPMIRVYDATSLWRNGTFPEGSADYPVTCVTVLEAREFCKWLGARYRLEGSTRLPDKEEWFVAAYGIDRKYPWGNEEKEWTSNGTHSVKARPDLRTPDGLYGMWGTVTELVLPSNGYGGGTSWMGPGYIENTDTAYKPHPQQDSWGGTHSEASRNNLMGFRIVFVPDK